MPVIIYGALAVATGAGVVFKLLSSSVADIGQGVNEASNGVVKVAIASGIGFIIAKKTGLI